MLREEEDSFLVTTRAEVPCFAGLLRLSGERAKIFMITVMVGAFDSCDTIWVVSALKKLFYCFFYPYYSVLAVLLCIVIVVLFFKIWKVVFEDLISPPFRTIDRASLKLDTHLEALFRDSWSLTLRVPLSFFGWNIACDHFYCEVVLVAVLYVRKNELFLN